MGVGGKIAQGLARGLANAMQTIGQGIENKPYEWEFLPGVKSNMTKQLDWARRIAEAKNVAKQKDPLEMLSGTMRDMTLLQSPEFRKQLEATGYLPPDIENLTPAQIRLLKLRQAGGGGGGDFNFGNMGAGKPGNSGVESY